MTSPSCLGLFRPCLRGYRPNHSSPKQTAYLQFYAAARRLSAQAPRRSSTTSYTAREDRLECDAPKSGTLQDPVIEIGYSTWRDDVRRRIQELEAAKALDYPRVKRDMQSISCMQFRKFYDTLGPGDSKESETVTLQGRLYSSRIAGSKLAFMDIFQDGIKVQGICDFGRLSATGTGESDFKQFCQLARRGDIISFTGFPSRTKRGELSLLATVLPSILSPALASLPTALEDSEARIRNRHADLLVNQKVADTLKLRSRIIQYLRDFLIRDSFLEFQTPILADGAGGAIARPFTTRATEFSDKTLSLRIAPEIWLKRLVLGGVDRVFEIGPAFRNEGIDATHNPEYTTCEFYKAFADLEELITMTESLISGLSTHVKHMIQTQYTTLPSMDIEFYASPFKRIEFVPTLEKTMGHKLPDLQSHDAAKRIVSIFQDLSIPLPESLTLPRLLDKLSSLYLEPQCHGPTFIIYPPACLAPLSKSFRDAATNQIVSARAELFLQGKEIANMYEEENSPFEQKKKFTEQAGWRDDENQGIIDEGYVEALLWGLPPTGGWGCGIDRLCMHFASATRISDVLAFGNLRNVVGLAKKNWTAPRVHLCDRITKQVRK